MKTKYFLLIFTLFILCITNNYAQQRGGIEFKGPTTGPSPNPKSSSYVDISSYRSLCGDALCQAVAIKYGASYSNPYVIPKENLNVFRTTLNNLCNNKTQKSNTSNGTNTTNRTSSSPSSSSGNWEDMGRKIGEALMSLFTSSANSTSEVHYYHDSRGMLHTSAKAAEAANIKYEKELRFNKGKKELLANSKGMRPIAGTSMEFKFNRSDQTTETMEFKWMGQKNNISTGHGDDEPKKTSATNGLVFKGINNKYQAPSVHIDNANGMPSVGPSKESEMLSIRDKRLYEMEDRLAQAMSMRRREEDRIRYEQNTPWYDKKIDKYNEKLKYEDLSLSEMGGAVVAHTAKGAVVLWNNAEGFVGDGIPKLITGQARKEINAAIIGGASSVLELITEGRAGKPEAEAFKGYGLSYKELFSSLSKENAGKEMFDDLWEGREVLVFDNFSNSNIKTAKNYLNAKGIVVPPVNKKEMIDMATNKAVEGVIINPANKLFKKEIRSWENSEFKQAVAYGNGVWTVGGGTFWGMEQHIKDKKLK